VLAGAAMVPALLLIPAAAPTFTPLRKLVGDANLLA
jgi:hypothetical protein